MESFLRATIQKPSQRDPTKNQVAVGPARPKIDYESSSSDDEDNATLVNDPIYMSQMSGIQKPPTYNNSNQINPEKMDEEQHAKQESDSEDEEDEQKNIKKEVDYSSLAIPLTHEAVIRGHTRNVTALAIDERGIRMATGGNDYKVKLWDFTGMTKSMCSFRELEPRDGQPIRALSYNVSSETLLVVCMGPQFNLFNKEGKAGHESVKGDMYISDMNKTHGHISTINDGTFSHNQNNMMATCSNDTTIRLWDINSKLFGIEQQLTQLNVLKCTDSRGIKTVVHKICYSQDDKMVYGGCVDGSILGFDVKQTHRAMIQIRNAHKSDHEIVSLECFDDDIHLVSRSFDETVKVWDKRQVKRPVAQEFNLGMHYPGARVCISPDQKYILCGSSQGDDVDERVGYLTVFDKDLNFIDRIYCGEGQVSDVKWHKKLNQIFVANGQTTKAFFDPQMSKAGALQCVQKAARKHQVDDYSMDRAPMTPHSNFRDPKYNREKENEKNRKDPTLSMRPSMPAKGVGKQGRIGNAATVQQHMLNKINSAPDKREDPQEALIKIAKNRMNKNDFQYIDNAYKDTMVTREYDQNTQNEWKEQTYLSSIKGFCPHCGLKICTCQNRLKFEFKGDKDEEEKEKRVFDTSYQKAMQ